jgi:NADPH:quinone reductase
MKALRFAKFGPPSVLQIEEVAIPEPGKGEALVQVKAAALNPSNIGDVAGRFKITALPRTQAKASCHMRANGEVMRGPRPWQAE